MTRMTRIIIANIIREIRVIRSSNHKVQCSKVIVQRCELENNNTIKYVL